MFFFLTLSTVSFVLHHIFHMRWLSLPFDAVATISVALGVYLGFKTNQAYERWWEGRKIWGLIVNYSRAYAREILTFPAKAGQDIEAQTAWQRKVIYRHMAWVHALRVYLRVPNGYLQTPSLTSPANTYDDLQSFLDDLECSDVTVCRNPPNCLLKNQGDALAHARDRGWLSDYQFVKLSQTLTEFNNHQGMAERIKNTPLPRPYSVFSRIFVLVHGVLVPFAFIEELDWMNIPLSLAINFIFLTIDMVGKQIEDPFENRILDVPLTSISIGIEENLKEMLGDPLPRRPGPVGGILF